LLRQKSYLANKKRFLWVKLIVYAVCALLFVLKFSVVLTNYALGIAVYRFFGDTMHLVTPSF
jgi:hypothetical protein